MNVLKQAFANAKVCKGVQVSLLERVGTSYDNTKDKQSRGWIANVSPKTTKQLVKEGVFG